MDLPRLPVRDGVRMTMIGMMGCLCFDFCLVTDLRLTVSKVS